MSEKNRQKDLNVYYRKKNQEDVNLLRQQTGRIKEITIAMGDFLDNEKKTHMAESKRVFGSSEEILSRSISNLTQRKIGRDFSRNQRIAQLYDLLLYSPGRFTGSNYFVFHQVINSFRLAFGHPFFQKL